MEGSTEREQFRETIPSGGPEGRIQASMEAK